MIHYAERGSGSPVLFLHGFCENSSLWEELSQFLAHSYRVLTPDLPGHGESSLPQSLDSLDDVASLLWTWLDECNVPSCAIIGHSLGGYVALAMLEQQPNRVEGIGLFHSTALADSTEKKLNRDKAISFISRYGDSAFKKNFVPSLFHKQCSRLDDLKAMVDATKTRTILAYSGWMRDRLQRDELLMYSGCSVLIIAGMYDEFIPLQSLKELANRIPDSTLCVLSDTGHLGMWEEPDASRKSLQEWLESLW